MEAASEQDIVPTWVANMWTYDTACLACLPRIMLDGRLRSESGADSILSEHRLYKIDTYPG